MVDPLLPAARKARTIASAAKRPAEPARNRDRRSRIAFARRNAELVLDAHHFPIDFLDPRHERFFALGKANKLLKG
jgi:hypothetical protein